MQGGKAGEDSHRKFNAGWKTGRPWLDFRKVTTTDHDSAGNSVLVTAMFCKWCEMAGFKQSRRKSVLHVKQMRWLRSMLSGIMRQTQM